MSTTVSQRLTQALEERGWSMRKLHQTVQSKVPAKRGDDLSYSSVRDYVQGHVAQPPEAFLRATAEALGVRFAYLAYNDGPPTELEASRADHDAAQMKDAIAAYRRRFEEQINTGLGRPVSVIAQYAVDQVASASLAAGGAASWQDVAEAIAAPLYQLGFHPETMPGPAFEHYVATAGEALRYLLREIAREAERRTP